MNDLTPKSNSMSDAIAAAGLGTPDIIHDGVIHRFTSPDDKPGSNNCWYVSHRTAGAFGSWKLGFSQTWNDGSSSPADDAKLREQIKTAQRIRQTEIKQNQKQAQTKAMKIWSAASTSIDHPYVTRKKINPYGARQAGDVLLVPLCLNGKIVNIQRIYPNGKKRFLRGARVTGCYCPVGTISDHIFIAEGYATSASLFERTGTAIAVAFNCGNLKPVALSIRKKYPSIKITVACDNDADTKGNPGLTKGREAAAAVGGNVIWPDFSDEDFNGSDFNDFLTQGGEL